MVEIIMEGKINGVNFRGILRIIFHLYLRIKIIF